MLLAEAIRLLERLRIDPSLYQDRFQQRVGRLIKQFGQPKYMDKTIAYWEGKNADKLGKIEIIVNINNDKVEIRNAGYYANRVIFNQRTKSSEIMVKFSDLFGRQALPYIKNRLKGRSF